MSRKEQIGFHYGAGVLIVSAILVKIIGACFKIPISSDMCLSDKGFGMFSFAYDLFTPFYTVALSGFPVALAKTIADKNREEGGGERVFGTAHKLYTKIGICFFITVLLVCLLLRFFKIGNQDLLLPVAAIAPTAFFCSAMSSYRGYYEGYGDMLPTAVSELIEASGKLILGFSFAFVTVRVTGNLAYGAAAAMLGISAGTCFSYLYLKIRFHQKHGDGVPIHLSNVENDTSATKSLLVLAFPITLAALSVNMIPLIDALVSQGRLGVVLYGIRAKAYTLYNLAPTFAVLLSVSAVPAVAHAAENDRERSILSVLKLAAVLGFPMAAGFVTAAYRVMDLFYSGDSVLIGGMMLRLYGFTAFFSVLAIPMTGILQAVGKQGVALRNIACGAVCKIVFTALLIRIPSLNVYGTAYASLLCYAVIFVLHFLSIKRFFVNLPGLAAAFLKPLFSALACGAAAFVCFQIGAGKLVTLLGILSAVLVYFFLLILLKCFTITEIPDTAREKSLIKFCMKYRIFR